MKKIATAEELQSELRSLWAMTEEAEPSREKLAATLQGLANRLSASPSIGEEMAQELKKSWRHVEFNKTTGKGSVEAGGVHVEFHESSNESAVWVDPTIKSVKFESAESALKYIEDIHDIWSRS